ncbi:uncharacterized protein (TIGR02231 family) [Flavobacterium croceum DSM 17960]|uniref:Uncharacterized protein (TIGR02231 family) n=1 Tax=Flavobacterium croceum DSM 17960 TaxID=1121886 RepID=A0A2S4N848_9FLAO|nr:DUF4139 domain-containing protein [Flavobacterium croceum]POS01870.1 uncharacterized protein (TIGR02231 family) [Flavobacterium croceum DSM 17960]
MKKHIVFLFIMACGFAQKPIFSTAKVKAVTVYTNAAELLQTTSVNLPVGTSEIVIKNVANYLNENTIQIGAPSTVTVLSVQFTKNYISEYEIDESNPAIKKVRDSIYIVQKEIQKIQTEKVSANKTVELLDKNQTVAGANNGMNVAELIKLADYYQNKRTELNLKLALLNEKEQKWAEKLEKLNNKLEINTQKEEQNSQGKLIVQVMNDVAGLVNFDLNYITNTASWSPFYDLRANSVKDPIQMMYKARVFQNSGVDWKKVKLTLSSGNPNQSNQAPLLQQWYLKLNNPYTYSDDEIKKEKLEEVVITNAYSIRGNGNLKSQPTASINNYTSINENQLNVSFDIDIPYDILSNGKAHSVALKEISLPAKYKYYAVPKLDKEAFLLAELNDYGKYNLLPGEANIIFEGMYVGKTNINPTQTTDTLSLSMGRDKKIAIKREKVAEKSGIKFLSNYKEQTFTYDITVRNNKKESVTLLLKDQYPLSTDKEIEVEVLESSKAKINEEIGVFNWDVKLEPNESKKFRISYKVKYPKDKIIDNL